MITLYYHPFSRAANAVWMLEEVQVPYSLEFIDLMAGHQQQGDFKKTNPMGKIPTIVDGDAVVTEAAAIGVYLADRYAGGRLAPALDAPGRGTYLRWCFYPSAVIEPGCMAHASRWEARPQSVGWGTYANMLDTIEGAIGEGPWVLGDTFSMADVIFGGTLRYMMDFKMIESRDSFGLYVERLNKRPASQKAQEVQQKIAAEHGLASS